MLTGQQKFLREAFSFEQKHERSGSWRDPGEHLWEEPFRLREGKCKGSEVEIHLAGPMCRKLSPLLRRCFLHTALGSLPFFFFFL